MRFTLAQLRKLRMPYSFNEELNLESELVGFEDILTAGMVNVIGVVNEIGKDKYSVEMDISVDLTLESAISLEPIPYSIETKTEEVYSVEDDDTVGDVSIIVGQTLDTVEAVVTSILIAKPMRMTKDDEEFISDEVIEEEVEEKVNPAFASLKDLLK